MIVILANRSRGHKLTLQESFGRFFRVTLSTDHNFNPMLIKDVDRRLPHAARDNHMDSQIVEKLRQEARLMARIRHRIGFDNLLALRLKQIKILTMTKMP